MNEVVARGEALLAAEAARVEAERLRDQAITDLLALAPTITKLLNTVLTRLAHLENAQTLQLEAQQMPRIRRPVRNGDGVIQYVVDELSAPGAI